MSQNRHAWSVGAGRIEVLRSASGVLVWRDEVIEDGFESLSAQVVLQRLLHLAEKLELAENERGRWKALAGRYREALEGIPATHWIAYTEERYAVLRALLVDPDGTGALAELTALRQGLAASEDEITTLREKLALTERVVEAWRRLREAQKNHEPDFALRMELCRADDLLREAEGGGE